ncbi:iron complex outermembrane receptor protein [Paucibacter oligotrophus]|uniref:Iron complex outermembrane receptor protein n=1 Tax=Roseateles oligotrophus TaxID=1769250 RepID=A0A840LEJ2_9BURK|nr:TonB-dependent siderophore receptor [Roseateles oligotrophus]MBB4845405.1 iron complex outermembrane receptor protein [Roseateles oligotrophus]
MKYQATLSMTALALLIGQAWAAEPAAAPAAAASAPAAAASAAEISLPLVRAKGRRENASGPIEGFVARRAGSGMKGDIALIETPQAITVVTADQIEAQGATALRQVTRYMAGASSATLDSRADRISARGGSVDQYLDGMLRSHGFANNTRPDPYTLERVELVRGPASVLYGQASLNGLLNLVSKRPQFETQREVQVQLGSFKRRQLATDLTGPLGEQWAYRLVALKRDSGTQVNHVKDDRLLLAPSLTWQPGADTSLTLQALHQRDRSGSLIGFFPWQGTRLPNGSFGRIPTSTFISEPGWDAYNTDQDSIGYLFSHRFAEHLTLRQNLRHSQSSGDYRTLYTSFSATGRPVFNADGRSLERDLVWQRNDSRMTQLDTQLEGQLRSGGWQHQLLLGLDVQRNVGRDRNLFERSTAIDAYAPVYGNFKPPAAPTEVSRTEQRQLGLYLQDHIKLGSRWVAVLGLRHDRARSDTSDDPDAKVDDKALSKRAGLLYQSGLGVSSYLAYTESFKPVGGVDFYKKPYKPQVGEQWELGLKWQPQHKRLSASATIYDLRDTNRLTPDPAQPNNSLQIGEVRIRGLELESAGSLAGAGLGLWDWTLAYAYTDAKISRSNRSDQGQAVAGVPRHSASAWLTHHFSLAGHEGFSAGAGVRRVSGAWAGSTRISTPAATLFDAMLAYERGDWRLALNANNLADEVQISNCLSRGDCMYGDRRSVNASLGYRF